ncbi:bifunctional DNA primase/polymerase [Sphingomonas oligophenolica]|uniref:bifunctional DNA primase/polymerase n=1 Tax=Sphingomonas oligophenolica TaxID=301154 RepID=UPI00138674FC
MIGIPDWPRRSLTDRELRTASTEPDYGISVRLGQGLAAFDVDVEDEDLANLFENTAYKKGFRGLCVRYRKNSPRRLILFRIADSLGKSVLRSNIDGAGCVEILGDGQQFVAAGAHPSGARYAWREIRAW